MRDNTEPTPENGFLVGSEFNNFWNLTRVTEWATNWTEGCSSFVVVTYSPTLPTTQAVIIANDIEDGWLIMEAYHLHEHQVTSNFHKALYYLGAKGLLAQWLVQIGLSDSETTDKYYVDFDEQFPKLVLTHTEVEMNGFEIYSVDSLIERHGRRNPNEGLFYILSDKVVCERCAHAHGTVTEEMLESGDVSACWSHDPWDHQECEACGVVFDAGDRVYHKPTPSEDDLFVWS